MQDSPVLHYYTSRHPDFKVLGKVYGPGKFKKLERRWVSEITKSKTSA